VDIILDVHIPTAQQLDQDVLSGTIQDAKTQRRKKKEERRERRY